MALCGLVDLLREALLDKAVLPMRRMETLPTLSQVRTRLAGQRLCQSLARLGCRAWLADLAWDRWHVGGRLISLLRLEIGCKR